MSEPICCMPKSLPPELLQSAAATAIAHNPMNAPPSRKLARMLSDVVSSFLEGPARDVMAPQHLALLTTKYWGVGGVHLTVSFLDGGPAELQARILSHMNAWGAYCNAKFSLTSGAAQVRITRTPGSGYWSYLGTDVLHIKAGQPTMNLDSFSMSTPESEYRRVVRHETGHTLGFPHEHMRRAVVERIDPAKAIAYFGRSQGWSASEVRSQVLTPLDEGSLLGPTPADVDSIMCYQLPGSIMRDGVAVPGGGDIDPSDQGYAAKVYPLAVSPPPPPSPPPPVSPPPVSPPAALGRVEFDIDRRRVSVPPGWTVEASKS
jgi:hypothetical protein